MPNSSSVIVLTSYDGKDTIFLSVTASLISQGYSPHVIGGLSRDFLRSTAYILQYSLLKFPEKSIFIVLNHINTSTVVARYNDKIIIAPNNGLITMVSEHITPFSVFDAPLQALLQSKPLQDILNDSREGHIIEAFMPQPVIDNDTGQITATIIHIDSFGNVVTNIKDFENTKIFSTLAPKDLNFVKRGAKLYSIEFIDVYPTYPLDEPPGKQVVFKDELGYLSCGIVSGDLADILNLSDSVEIKISLKNTSPTQSAPYLSIPKLKSQ